MCFPLECCVDPACGASLTIVLFILCNEQNHISSPDRLECCHCHSYKVFDAIRYSKQFPQTTKRILMFPGPCPYGELYYPNIPWKDNKAGHKKSRGLLDISDENCWTQVMK